MKSIHLFLLTAALILLAACAEVDTKSDGTTEIRLPGGGKVTHNESGLELPADFPNDVLGYPNAKLTHTVSSPSGSTVSFQTDASINEVTAYYEKKLKESGWKLNGNFKTAEGTMISAMTPESRGASIAIVNDKKTGKTLINIIRQ